MVISAGADSMVKKLMSKLRWEAPRIHMPTSKQAEVLLFGFQDFCGEICQSDGNFRWMSRSFY
jgi:hypothetical protein